MSDHRYVDVFLKEEDHLSKEMFRGFVETEIMPARQWIDDDKDHRTIRRILQKLTDLGMQKAAFPKEYDCKIIQLWEGGAQLGRFDVCRGYYDCGL